MTDWFPSGWTVTSLGALCEDRVTQAGPANERVSYIDIGSIDRSTKRVGETTAVSRHDAPTRARQWVRAGDVLVSMTRPNLNAVAQIGLDLDGAVASTGFDVLRPRGVEPKWIFYRVRSNDFVADMCRDLQGVVYPAIRPHDVRRHHLPLPPLSEQRRITGAIESYFTRLDDAAATLERVQRNLKRYRASVLKAAVEGRLVPTEAELARAEGRSYEPASVLLQHILAERRRRWEKVKLAKKKGKETTPKDDNWNAKYAGPAAPDTEQLPGLPEGWCWTTIGSVTECLDSMRIPVSKKERATKKGSVPYYGANGRAGWIDEALFDEPLVLVVEDETFTGRTEPFTYRVEGPSWVNNHAHVLRPLQPLTATFVNYSLMFYPFTPLTTGTTGRRKLTQKALMSAPYALPPVIEQERIVEAVERHLSLWQSANDAIIQTVLRSSRLRQCILRWAFEGRLVDQDPSDEPASVLLERIRAERQAEHADTSARPRPRASQRRRDAARAGG